MTEADTSFNPLPAVQGTSGCARATAGCPCSPDPSPQGVGSRRNPKQKKAGRRLLRRPTACCWLANLGGGSWYPLPTAGRVSSGARCSQLEPVWRRIKRARKLPSPRIGAGHHFAVGGPHRHDAAVDGFHLGEVDGFGFVPRLGIVAGEHVHGPLGRAPPSKKLAAATSRGKCRGRGVSSALRGGSREPLQGVWLRVNARRPANCYPRGPKNV